VSGGRWRSIGKAGLFWAGNVAILLLFGTLRGMSPPEWRDLLWGCLSTGALLALTAWFLRRERRTFDSVGAGFERGSAVRALLGMACGLLLYALIFGLVSLVAGPILLVPASGGASLAGAMLVVVSFIALSAMEEVGFRGYPLRTLAPELGEWPAQLIVAAAFGGSHILYGWPWQAVLLGVIPSGLLFGAAATYSRGLAFPIGLHAALNLGAWAVGTKETPGLWTVVVPDGAAGRITSVAIGISFAVTLGAIFALHGAKARRVFQVPTTTVTPTGDTA
jgi:CAAX protease family protein